MRVFAVARPLLFPDKRLPIGYITSAASRGAWRNLLMTRMGPFRAEFSGRNSASRLLRSSSCRCLPGQSDSQIALARRRHRRRFLLALSRPNDPLGGIASAAGFVVDAAFALLVAVSEFDPLPLCGDRPVAAEFAGRRPRRNPKQKLEAG